MDDFVFFPPMFGLTPICKHLNFPFLSRTRQGLMYQQQELYRHQQEALARLQDEADRLRQETLGKSKLRISCKSKLRILGVSPSPDFGSSIACWTGLICRGLQHCNTVSHWHLCLPEGKRWLSKICWI